MKGCIATLSCLTAVLKVVLANVPIQISAERLLEVEDDSDHKRSRSLPTLESELLRSGSSIRQRRAPENTEPTAYYLVIRNKVRKLVVRDMYQYTGGYAFYDAESEMYLELLPFFEGPRVTQYAAPQAYREETVQAIRELNQSPYNQFFPALVDSKVYSNGCRFIAFNFRPGISLENIFNTPSSHPFPMKMYERRARFLEAFPFYLAQLITMFEILSDYGIFNGKVKLSTISVLEDGNLELSDLRDMFRPSISPRKYVIASMPWAPPEVRTGKHVGAFSHFYSLGGLVYEIVTGLRFVPDAAVEGKLYYPERIGDDLKEIIQLLLTVDYEKRIAALGKIKPNRYFKYIDWIAMQHGQLEAPILSFT